MATGLLLCQEEILSFHRFVIQFIYEAGTRETTGKDKKENRGRQGKSLLQRIIDIF